MYQFSFKRADNNARRDETQSMPGHCFSPVFERVNVFAISHQGRIVSFIVFRETNFWNVVSLQPCEKIETEIKSSSLLKIDFTTVHVGNSLHGEQWKSSNNIQKGNILKYLLLDILFYHWDILLYGSSTIQTSCTLDSSSK